MADEGFWARALGRIWHHRARRRLAREVGRQWILLTGPRPADFRHPPNVSSLLPVLPPNDRFWADPFLWSRDGRHQIFFEEYPYALGRGRIATLEIDAKGQPLGAVETVMAPEHHLSYPFLFEADGELFMVPEQKATRRVEVFVCRQFPQRFERVRTWFCGVRMVDVTVFCEDGRWWLFAAEKREGLRYDETLYAYSSDHPIHGDWIAHARNPLVVNLRGARCGGRIFKDPVLGWLRPAQDCHPHYGAGLGLCQIEQLSPDCYQERSLWRLSGEEAGGYRGLHHLDVHGDLMVMDAERVWAPAGADACRPP